MGRRLGSLRRALAPRRLPHVAALHPHHDHGGAAIFINIDPTDDDRPYYFVEFNDHNDDLAVHYVNRFPIDNDDVTAVLLKLRTLLDHDLAAHDRRAADHDAARDDDDEGRRDDHDDDEPADDLHQLRARALDDFLAWFVNIEPLDEYNPEDFLAAKQSASDYLDAWNAARDG